eukprot:m.197032 g.197032  ORF g.197032 m.197032 type:complete len:808 (+) comp17657_c0_seq1:69-2492(+)
MSRPPGYRNAPKYSLGDGSVEMSESSSRQHSRAARLPRQSSQEHMRDLMNQLPSAHPEAYTIVEASRATGRPVNADIIEEIIEEVNMQNEQPGNVSRTLSRHAQLARSRRSRNTQRRKSSKRSVMSSMLDEETQEAIYEAKHILENVRNQTAKMTTKLDIYREEQKQLAEAKTQLPWWYIFLAEVYHVTGWLWHGLKSQVKGFGFWNQSIKSLEGKHGAAVGTFFTFHRWCLLLNLLIAMIWVGFVIIPTAVKPGFDSSGKNLVPPPEDVTSDLGANLVGLITGGAKMNRTAYFIGSYFMTLDQQASNDYKMPLAYLMCCGAYMFLSFYLIYLGVYRAVNRNAALSDEGQHVISEIVFTSYDHSLTDPKSIRVKRGSLVRLLREIMDEETFKKEYDMKEKHRIYAKRVLVNIIILIILALSLWAVQASVTSFADDKNEAARLIPSIILSGFNLALPVAFEQLARYEEWRTPLFVIQLSVIRAVVLRLVGLFVFFYTVFTRRDAYMCWESFVGQQAYNLFMVVFLFELVTSIAIDPVKRYMHNRFEWTHKYFQTARFQTIKNTLEIIYGQSIVWFGTFYCPIMPVLAVIKLVVLFYVKKYATMHFCAPPERAFKATHSLKGLIYFVMLLALLGIAIPLGYTIVQLPTSGAYMPSGYQEMFTNVSPLLPTCATANASCLDCLSSSRVDSAVVCFKPTSTSTGSALQLGDLCDLCPSGCGPFRNQDSVYRTMKDEFDSWPSFIQHVLNIVGTLSFALIILFVIGTWLLFVRAENDARSELIVKLKNERDIERIDKIWILEKYSITLDSME